jgi:golgi-specific brefeldin A-resistance guanine nucleotide exchange factor 1
MMMIEKLVLGIRYCVTLGSAYQLVEMMEFVVLHLGRMTGLVKQDQLPAEVDVLLKKKERKKHDRWLIDLGQNYRAQVSTVLLFSIASEFGEQLGNGWHDILLIVGNLFLHQCLPLELETTDHFISKLVTIPRVLIPKAVEEPKKEVGLFSSFAQFLTLSSENEDFGDPQADQWEGYAIECIDHCSIKELIEETKFMTTTGCLSFLSHLVQLSTEKTNSDGDSKSNFTCSAVFYMEFIFWILLKNRDRIQSLWSGLEKYWSLVMTPSTPAVLIERCCINILKLLLRLTHVDAQSQVFGVLEKVHSLPTEMILMFGEHLVTGFLTVAKSDFHVLSRNGRCQVLFRVLSVTAAQPFASTVCFELMSMVVGGHPEAPLTSDYFGDIVDLLVSFSSGVYGTTAPRSSVTKITDSSK